MIFFYDCQQAIILVYMLTRDFFCYQRDWLALGLDRSARKERE